MTGGHRVRRFVLAGIVMAGLVATPAPGTAQAGWPFYLEWEHEDGGAAWQYRLCVNGQCGALAAQYMPGNGKRARLPVMPPGEYRLVVEACGSQTCIAGTPDLMIRVLPASGRRPPIDVIDGPRIPASRR